MSEDRTSIKLSRAQLAILDSQIHQVLERDNPQSLRNVYYKQSSGIMILTVPKTKGEYERISARLCDLRDAGTVPYAWVTDGTREFEGTQQEDTEHTATPWQGHAKNVVVFCESTSLYGVIASVCKKYQVGLSACGGMASHTMAYDAIVSMNKVDKPVLVLYLGDYDRPGFNGQEHLLNRLERYAQVDVELIRVGITASQIQEFNLPQMPPKGKYVNDPVIKYTTEAEAMDTILLKSILEDAILLQKPDMVGVALRQEALDTKNKALHEYGMMVWRYVEAGHIIPDDMRMFLVTT